MPLICIEGDISIDIWSDPVQLANNGRLKLLSQVIQFVPMTDPYGCKFKFNAVTITWKPGYKMDRRQRLAALAFEMRKANLKARIVKADMVERNILCNKASHLSEFGCDQCVCKTVGGHYPVEQTFDAPLRDELSWQREVRAGTTFLGRKGPSALHDLPGFKITEGLSVDPMHQIFVGHTHFLIKKFVLSDACHKGLKVKEKILMEMNRVYNNIRVPREVQRPPRDYEKTWCSNELKVFLLTCGHRLADIFEEHGLPEIALLFGRFTFCIRALLLPEEWLVDVEHDVNVQDLLKEHLQQVESLLGESDMNANSHSLAHLRFWKTLYNLSDLSCEPGEAFFGQNKRRMDVRCRHYGRQIHYNSLTEYLRGHQCCHVFRLQATKPRNNRHHDDGIVVDKTMRVYRQAVGQV